MELFTLESISSHCFQGTLLPTDTPKSREDIRPNLLNLLLFSLVSKQRFYSKIEVSLTTRYFHEAHE